MYIRKKDRPLRRRISLLFCRNYRRKPCQFYHLDTCLKQYPVPLCLAREIWRICMKECNWATINRKQGFDFMVDTRTEHLVVIQKVAPLSGWEVTIIRTTWGHPADHYATPLMSSRQPPGSLWILILARLPSPSNGQRPFSQNGSRNNLCPR